MKNTNDNKQKLKLSSYYGTFGGPCIDDIIRMETTHFGDYDFICTASACPEQYDVVNKTTDKQCGYIRLRHGELRCDYPDCRSENIFYHRFMDDPDKGQFNDDAERAVYLQMCLDLIIQKEVQTANNA